MVNVIADGAMNMEGLFALTSLVDQGNYSNVSAGGFTATGDGLIPPTVDVSGAFVLFAGNIIGGSIDKLVVNDPLGATYTFTLLKPVDYLAFKQQLVSGPVNGLFNLLSGSDVITGSQFKDTLVGYNGGDTISGGAGSDHIDGGAGIDTLNAGAGNDTVKGGNDADRLYGRQGKDKLSGDGGGDYLNGGRDADTLFGGDGDDRASGGSGNDRIHGGYDDDILIGGEGSDRFYFDRPEDDLLHFGLGLGVDRIRDFTHGEDQIRLDGDHFKGLGSGDLAAKFFHLGATPGDGNDRLLYSHKTGALHYDRDGSGDTYAAVKIAVLSDGHGGHPTVSAHDFFVF